MNHDKSLATMVRRHRGLMIFAVLVLAAKIATFELVLAADPDVYRTNDSERYTALASELLQSGQFAVEGEPEVMRTPGYPLFLAAMMGLAGSEHIVVLIQILLSFAVAGLVWSLVRSRDPPVEPRMAAAGAFAIVVLDPALTSAQFLLMSEVPFLLAVTAGLFCVHRHFAREHSGSLWGAVIALTIASYIRPIGLYLPILFVGVLAIRSVTRRKRGWLRHVGQLVLALSVYALLVGGWVIRNERVSGVATFSSAGATHLYETLAAATVARVQDRSWHDVRDEFRRTSYRVTEDEAERGEYAMRHAREILTSHPGEAVLIALQGTVTTLLAPGTGQFANIFDLRETDSGITSKYYDMSLPSFVRYLLRHERVLVAFLTVGAGWILLYWGSSLTGLTMTVRSNGSAFDVIMVLTAVYFISLAAGPSGMARYRIPALPVAAYYGGIGLAWLRSYVKSRRRTAGPRMDG